MFNGDKERAATYFLTQLETFIQGVRQWNPEMAVHDAELIGYDVSDNVTLNLFICRGRVASLMLRIESRFYE